MNTTEVTPELQPCPERPRRIGPPVGGHRILTGYALVALAFLCGIPVLVVCLIAGNACTSPGFGCLGWLVYGLLGGALAATVALLALALKFRMGLGFWLLTVVLLIAWIALQHDERYVIAAVLLSPAAAAWLSQPPSDRPRWQHWLPRILVLILLAALLPMAVQGFS